MVHKKSCNEKCESGVGQSFAYTIAFGCGKTMAHEGRRISTFRSISHGYPVAATRTEAKSASLKDVK